ncbi:MAG: 5-(carboxyamino)imidazole ribonucleotide mutase [Gammaproteobacteria bacterium]
MKNKLVAVVYGSLSDWNIMEHCVELLEKLGISYHTQVVSAHRTPELLFEFSKNAKEKGFEVIIAGAGGAAHLPGMVSSLTTLPVLGVPMPSASLDGMDSLLSIVQMPAGIPVGTLAIGKSGAINAGLLAAAILANKYPDIDNSLKKFRDSQTEAVLSQLYPESL